MQELCSALLLKVSETMSPGEPGGPSPPSSIARYRRKFKQKIYDQVEILEISDTNNTNEDFCTFQIMSYNLNN
ncbi:unnamed protein product [Rhizophagus irregularis]|nr:unnamed protein product [Rhizophagus irregularis]